MEWLETLPELIEAMFIYIENGLSQSKFDVMPGKIELIYNSYLSLLLFYEKMKAFVHAAAEDVKKEKYSVVNVMYYLSDRYFIPIAKQILLSLKNISIQAIFFKIVLLLLELVPAKGKMLAVKLCQSSFLKTVYDFKVLASQTSKELDEVLAKIILQLCMSVDLTDVQCFFEEVCKIASNRF